MISLLIAGWFVATFISKVADLGILYIKNHRKYRNVKDKLKKLEKHLRKIQAAIFEVDKRQITNPGLEEWLWDLKDAVYDAEDVIDGFEYNFLEVIAKSKNQLEKQNQLEEKNLSKKKNKVKDVFKQLTFRDEDLTPLDDVEKIFKGLVDELDKLLKVVELNVASNRKDDAEIPNWRRSTSSFKPKPVKGRQDELERILKVLLEAGDESNSNSNKFSLVSIVGPGGIGKTELARLVYNDVSLDFDIKAWVCVCNNFDVKRLSIEIIESAAIQRPIDLHTISNLDEIQKILSEGLKGKKFLIVLDDVWEEANSNWENLCTPFRSGDEGSKIIVTTQLESVAKMLGTKDIVTLDGLEDGVYWELFKECALGDQTHTEHRKLESIGREVAQKLGGSPLAAVTVGRALNSDLKEEHWRRILRKKIYEIEEKEGDIVSVLRLSYDQLPAHLKQCYLSCSLFPKNHSFERNELLHIWMALGFVQANDRNDRMEDVGEDLIDELSCRSLFVNDKRKKNKFVIHPVLHELADRISDGEYFRLESEIKCNQLIRIPDKARHIYVTANNLVKVSKTLRKKKNVRSLVVAGKLSPHVSMSDFTNSLEEVLNELKFLRLLIVSELGSGFPKAIEAIGGLKHLRYLELPGKVINEWPESCCKLYHLQWLNLKEGLKEGVLLPGKMNMLIGLRCLISNPAAISTIAEIGKLTSLQELEKYCVQPKKGFDLGQLWAMNQLRGRLCISDLQHVDTREEAEEAMLDSKEHLSQLELDWSFQGFHVQQNIQHSKCEEVIEGLKPHPNLRKLMISGYEGCKSPTWMKNNFLSNLEHIVLCYCNAWKVLPPFGELPFLRKLHLRSMSSIKNIGITFFCIDKNGNHVIPQKEKVESNVLFPSLEELVFDNLANWFAWEDIPEGFTLFPCLRKLFIWRCDNLRGSLPLPSLLNELIIRLSPSGALNKLLEENSSTSMFKIHTDGVNLLQNRLREGKHVPPLTLEINGKPVLESLINETWFFQLNSLKQLTLINCRSYNPPELQMLSFPLKNRIREARKADRLQSEGLPASPKVSRNRKRDEELEEHYPTSDSEGHNTQPIAVQTPEKKDRVSINKRQNRGV